MQAGFSLCEAGFTRAKNTGNILMKNLMDFCIGTPAFWLVGFGLMFGNGSGIIGSFDPLIRGDYSQVLPSGVPLWAFVIFQTVFCATSATIVSGAMAERTKFSAYCIYSAAISLLIYPVSGHWIWGGGWLSQMGFHDFAGSTAVHMVGGICALIGAKILGPRIGKYDKNGKPQAILGHNLTFAALGVFTWIRYKKPDVSMTYNAALAGLVGITAGCDAVDAVGAAIIGIVCGVLIVLSVEFFDKVAKIDDPVGAVSVHCVCGATGTILTGLFATGVTTEAGLFYGGGVHFLGIQVLGVLSVAVYVAVIITVVFLALKHTIGLRAKAEDEIAGLDVSEHGLLTAYAGFSMLPDTIVEDVDTNTVFTTGDVPVAEAIPVKKVPAFEDGIPKFTKVEIVCKESRLEPLKAAMMDLGITGMTVSHVLGCGVQKGKPESYRGVQILYTGHIGDGKIFVYDVENVVKIRTGEEGFDALQDVE